MARVNVVVAKNKHPEFIGRVVKRRIEADLPAQDYGSHLLLSYSLRNGTAHTFLHEHLGGSRNEVIEAVERNVRAARSRLKGFFDRSILLEVLGPDGELVLDISVIVADYVDKVLEDWHLSGRPRMPQDLEAHGSNGVEVVPYHKKAPAPLPKPLDDTSLVVCKNLKAEIDFESMKATPTDPLPARIKMILECAGIRTNGDLLAALGGKVRFTLDDWMIFMKILKSKNPGIRNWMMISKTLNTWLSDTMRWIHKVPRSYSAGPGGISTL